MVLMSISMVSVKGKFANVTENVQAIALHMGLKADLYRLVLFSMSIKFSDVHLGCSFG